MAKRFFLLTLLVILLAGCTRSLSADYAPLNPAGVSLPTTNPALAFLPPTRIPGSPLLTPTPDAPNNLPTPRINPDEYSIQSGDTISGIAQQFGVTAESILAVNPDLDVNWLDVGQIIKLPQASASAAQNGSSFKIIPDSELVFGPVALTLDIEDYVRRKDGFLASYTQVVEGQFMTGAQIVEFVALNYSASPRLLLAILEHQSGWVTNSKPANTEHPIHYVDDFHAGLYRQLTWAADSLNYGFYNYRKGLLPHWSLADGSVMPIGSGINAGTAAVQYFFGLVDGAQEWQKDVSLNGFFSTYFLMFGYPFDLALEPLLPPDLSQPLMQLPFEPGKVWYFTGGPHGGWDSGSDWAALDFAPPGEAAGCVISADWVTAVADGLVVRSEGGVVAQDLDNDGFEQSGWVVIYLHVDSSQSTPVGTYLKAGNRIGHPSCQGGFSLATHLHIARKFNGVWVGADGNLPFALDGWISSGTGREYDGFIARNGQYMEAWDGASPSNQIGR